VAIDARRSRYTGSGMKVQAATPPGAKRVFTTISGVPVEAVYGPEQIRDIDTVRDLGAPGQFPYTRGIHESMYRGKLWTMRQFSGFATPEETNRRYHYLLEQGQTGL
jgi:methylmalonyl-CoA mutase N-terminal domain/subunit